MFFMTIILNSLDTIFINMYLVTHQSIISLQFFKQEMVIFLINNLMP